MTSAILPVLLPGARESTDKKCDIIGLFSFPFHVSWRPCNRFQTVWHVTPWNYANWPLMWL